MTDLIKVVSIIKFKKNQYKVKFSNDEEIKADENLILKYRLLKDHVLEEGDLPAIKADTLYFDLYEKGLNYLSKNMTSKGKMKDYLEGKGATPSMADDLVLEYTKRNLLNDDKYMEALCNHYLNNGYGKNYILNIAYKYKIEREVALLIVNQLNYDDFLEKCIELSKRKLKSLEKYDDFKKKTKLYSYLQNRGYDYDIINSCIKEIL